MAAEIYVAKRSTTTAIKLYSVVYDSNVKQVYIHKTQWHRAHTMTKMYCPWTKEPAYCMCKTINNLIMTCKIGGSYKVQGN